ncbi:MAG TPA: hypothetical protein VIL74_15245 [Pyrinomonadaceae bacterium]
MRFFKLSILFLVAALFATACSRGGLNNQATSEYELRSGGVGLGYDDDNRWARENLDLQAVGELLLKADDAAEFEQMLNDPDNGVNNIDLNGDGYADYISVREFDERYDDERGFSLFSRFGPEEIQEICTIIFDRDRDGDRYYPGARVLLTGNDRIYGDNYYYESNWRDRELSIVDWLFTDRGDYYRSPYYYENYPSYYEPYQVVETPVYRTRIDQYYAEPVFIQTAQPSIREIRIESPYRERSINRIYSNLAKPTREQVEFRRNNPGPPEFVRERKESRQFNNNPNRAERPEFREKPNKRERADFEAPRQVKAERQVERQFEKQQQRELKQQQRESKQQQRFEQRQQQQQQRFEKQQMKEQKRENRGGGWKNNDGGGWKNNGGGGGGWKNNGGGNPNKGGGGNPNKGGGNGNGGGNKGGGGGKGKGKG